MPESGALGSARGVPSNGHSYRKQPVVGCIGVQDLPRPERVPTSAWCSCRVPSPEIQREEAWKRLALLRFSASRLSNGVNQRRDACEVHAWLA